MNNNHSKLFPGPEMRTTRRRSSDATRYVEGAKLTHAFTVIDFILYMSGIRIQDLTN